MWEVYTDGSAHGNPGPAGAGAVIVCGGKKVATLHHKGGFSTNNRMELYAVIMAVDYLPTDEPVTIYTDSQYVKNGLNSWLAGWVRKGWRKANGEKVKNRDLWEQLLQIKKDYPLLTIKWVKAHNGHKWNELADSLANKGASESEHKN